MTAMVCPDTLIPQGLPPYCRLKETSVTLGGFHWSIYSVANVDDLVDRAASVEDLPFWADLWPSALALAGNLIRCNLQNKSVLELGAGVGLAGLAAREAGADVVQSDFVPLALEFCRVNALKNGVDGIRLLQADWRHFPCEPRYDIICGSDILYEPALHPHLQSIFETVLRPGGRVILADPMRPHADAFSRRMRSAGWLENLDIIMAEGYGRSQIAVAVYDFHKTASVAV